MFNQIKDFAKEWEEELKLTEKVMEALTDESLSREVVFGRRTLGDIAWHLVLSPHYMTGLGLVFDGPEGGNQVPESASVIAKEYAKVSHALLDAVVTQWDNDKLLESQDMMGQSWKNGATLRFTVMHQAHHRGQMTVLMRQAGLRIPEVYGQTYDSWIDAGMEPLK
ncbi:putative damage-inducible protein DinB [Fontibacillus phaseoli]|uniref:Putative damage-inducible protein DinB n=1 Tax=Fontibacillus phaseoli TaxID=1416533 RepID=A0A369BK41_9BACL|nr:DinB family protein [Fontibacillus phaseoli]RCX21781.1 putative damage-inducible protein DinB [Fontibacillus phaseoli]